MRKIGVANFILLNAGEGRRTKSYGPKCLLQLKNQESLIKRQIRIIKKHYPNSEIYHSLGFDHTKVVKHLNLYKHYFINEHYKDTNEAYSLFGLLEYYDIKNTFVIFGDIVFDEKHFPGIPHKTTVYTSQNYNENKLGINANNGRLDHMMWGLESTWAEMMFMDKSFIDFACKEYRKEINIRSFLFEHVNNYITNTKKSVDVEPLGSDVIDIDCLQHLDIANEKFSISEAPSGRSPARCTDFTDV